MSRKRDKREQHDWVSATDGDARLVTFHEDIPPNVAKRVLAIQKDIQTGKIQGTLFAGEDFYNRIRVVHEPSGRTGEGCTRLICGRN